MEHTPLHLLDDGHRAATAGRVRRDDNEHRWTIFNAHRRLRLDAGGDTGLVDGLEPSALVRVQGRRDGDRLVVDSLDQVHVPPPDSAEPTRGATVPVGRTLRARDRMYRTIRGFFRQRQFLEVHTRALTRAPGTDPYIDPVPARFTQYPDDDDPQRAYLHTSPELKMKRLIAEGSGPIFQLGRAWRNGEVTRQHNPEFTILEWYRPWRDVDAIIDDVENLVCRVLHDRTDRPVDGPIRRMTMQQVVDAACGFDILEALDVEELRRQIRRHDLLNDRHLEAARWDELFFSLTVNHLDPYLADQGAVFVVDWPRPLAILAERSDDDPRVARRFELYVDGVELANGFGELTDPDEQRERFEQDNAARRQIGHPELPIPSAFLGALHRGMPPAAGVAMGVDRLLVLAVDGAEALPDVLPFALYRDVGGIQWP